MLLVFKIDHKYYGYNIQDQNSGSHIIFFVFLYNIFMELYVLDTNVFFNMEARFGLGEKTEDVVKLLTAIIKKQTSEQSAIYYMTPRTVEEFLSFFDDKSQLFLTEFISSLTVKTPDYSMMQIPSHILSQFIDEVRQRAYRGMNIAEEEMKNVGQIFMGKEVLPKKDFEITIGQRVKHFRERYRHATRYGFIDSVADLDNILLAKELQAYLITSDEGIVKWGRTLGIKEMRPEVFGQRVRDVEVPHHQG